MDSCEKNAFCAALPEDIRLRLCKHCIKTSFAENTSLPVDVNHPWLVIDGLMLCLTEGKPSTIVEPGAPLLTPHFAPANIFEKIPDEYTFATSLSDVRYYCLTPMLVATFSARSMLDCMDDPRFLKVLLDAEMKNLVQMSFYQRFLYQKSAYKSVRFILQIAREYGITGLTHDKIAKLAGRNRTTVTEVMQRIILTEPELLEGI